MINSQYKKDFDGQYLIIVSEEENSNYSLKMLLNNKIKGLLSLDLHIVDNVKQYHYDITSRQSLTRSLDNIALRYEEVKKIMEETIKAIEEGKEYLLLENDFVLDPDYLYILPTYEVSLCYLDGYQKDITDQLSSLIEYLMNKVDYNDEQGILFIYGLYKISKEEYPTFDKLLDFINNKCKKEEFISKKNNRISINKSTEKSNIENNKDNNYKIAEKSRSKVKRKVESKDKSNKKFIIPIMEERLESEEEVMVYSEKAIGFSAFSVMAYIILILMGYKFELYYDKFNEKLDIIKMFGYILVLGTGEIYLLSKLLHKKNKIPKIKGKVEYINDVDINETESEEEEKENRTVLLDNYNSEKTTFLIDEELTYILKSTNSINYKDIKIIEFPFFFGKLNDQVDKSVKSNVISRFHAKIEQKGEGFFITDLNSTNGTYLNSNRLKADVPKELHLGDEVRMANITYQFEILNEII
ncbi:FHA domain-containing protein [Mobilisporobacter senegalensis]|uniref:FHA domain-containing protein n=1 Tax=Mobilisporobacter senegalensis TaxID=1329262 RepID=A0A3N1XFS7_9FIRM|nr:DUF6382 domain-containing protein [Mobilisporobacter senegalensis]ROR23667.1 FHA domain-containing protein [Mobilisporobacter senegalensis]